MSAYTPNPGNPDTTGKGGPTVQAERRTAEVADRVRVVRGLLESRLYAADVVRLTQSRFGVSRPTARKYVRDARKELRASTGLTRREHRAVALEFYATIVRASLLPRVPRRGDPGYTADAPAPEYPGVPAGFRATVWEGLAAQQAIDKLLGLAVDRDPELDALKVTLRGLIATLEPHAAAMKAALPAAAPEAGA